MAGSSPVSQQTDLETQVQAVTNNNGSQESTQQSVSQRRALLASSIDATGSDASPSTQEPHLAKEGRAQALAQTTGIDSWAAARIPKAIWRGSSTGYLRGWSPLTASDPENHKSHAARSLMNKRIYMAAMGRVYPWLDVGLVGPSQLGRC
jgi:hypothetical protein